MEPEAVRVRVLKEHVYAGLPRRSGARYSMQAKDVRLMSLIGFVTPVIKREQVETEDPPIKPRRRYKRRDMNAE